MKVTWADGSISYTPEGDEFDCPKCGSLSIRSVAISHGRGVFVVECKQCDSKVERTLPEVMKG